MSDYFIEVIAAILAGILGFCFVVILVYLVTTPMQMHADAVCLAHGFPQSTFNYKFEFYCVKRVNQTDVVVPLSQVEKES